MKNWFKIIALLNIGLSMVGCASPEARSAAKGAAKSGVVTLATRNPKAAAARAVGGAAAQTVLDKAREDQKKEEAEAK